MDAKLFEQTGKESGTALNRNENGCIFALELLQISIADLLKDDGEKYCNALLARQIDWLTCLINSPAENAVFDLRIVANPAIPNSTTGRITAASLCRCNQATPEQALKYAIDFDDLCRAFFENEYELHTVSDSGKLESLLLPFAARSR